jgi:galactokinase
MVNTPPHVELPLRLLVQFQTRYPDTPPEIILQAPGRDLYVMATPTEKGRVILDSVELNARAVFSAHSAAYKQTITRRPLPKWARYAAGVLLICDDLGLGIHGMNAVIGGDEPTGPRYEYTLGVLMAALVHHAAGQNIANSRLFELADRARREYVEMTL